MTINVSRHSCFLPLLINLLRKCMVCMVKKSRESFWCFRGPGVEFFSFRCHFELVLGALQRRDLNYYTVVSMLIHAEAFTTTTAYTDPTW